MSKLGRKSMWKNSWYVKSYELAKEGLKNAQIGKALGMDPSTFRLRVMKDKSLRLALKKAREDSSKNAKTFRDYVYGRLPTKLQALWNEIQKCEETDNPIEQVEALLNGSGKRTKQHLFLYALVHYNFNITKAMACLNLARNTFNSWVTEDPDFGELIQEIHLAKKDFFESALVGLVKNGDTSAIIFANKTVNADRGYNPSKNVNVKHEGKVEHGHTVTTVPIKDLGLTLGERTRLLEAYRKRQAKIRKEQRGDGE